jgi:hypothetical protein
MNCKCRPPCLLQAIWLNAERRLVGLACNAASMPDLSAKARKDASLNGLDMGPGARLALRACKPQQCTNPSGAQHPCSYAIHYPATDTLVPRVTGPCARFAVNRTVGHRFGACVLTGIVQ